MTAPVAGAATAPPGFGQADLTNCEREQIHLAGSIQPHGALLLLREPDLVVVQASANAAEFLGIEGEILGRKLAALGGDLAARVGGVLGGDLDSIPVALRCQLACGLPDCDALVHRPLGGGLVVELERCGAAVDLSRHLQAALETILGAHGIGPLCDAVARLFRDLAGYDRVMVYRFDEYGHGEVIAEEKAAPLTPYLGNRYPASDIPQIARRLYARNRVRVLADIDYVPVPLRPPLSPVSGGELDMSLCTLRSISPIHVQYMKNMGVSATLVASLMVGGQLWGLVACHHYAPRPAPFEVRAVCELLAEAIGTRITALEGFAQSQAELSVRRLEQRMIEAITREGDWRGALFDAPQTLLQPLGASGAALLFEGGFLTAGEVPGTAQLRAIGRWLDARPRAPVISTQSLREDAPELAALGSIAAGLLATPVSASGGEYLVWLRPERIRTLTWGGNPFKPVLVGDDPLTLSPRRSFTQWHQVVEGTAEPWTVQDLTTARLIGETLTDVVLQFRSVRMLIAHDQLSQVRGQVALSGQPVIVAAADGSIQMLNAAFARLLPEPEPGATQPPLHHLDDLLPLFERPEELRQRLADMLASRRNWRGEVALRAGNRSRPMQLRADAVQSGPDRLLGFVLMFTDLTERRAADAARRRFQDGIVEGHRLHKGRLDSDADLMFENVLSSVVENAQLAALEITDGVDVAQMPQMLESVSASVARTTEVLEHLVRHAAGPPAPAPEQG